MQCLINHTCFSSHCNFITGEKKTRNIILNVIKMTVISLAYSREGENKANSPCTLDDATDLYTMRATRHKPATSSSPVLRHKRHSPDLRGQCLLIYNPSPLSQKHTCTSWLSAQKKGAHVHGESHPVSNLPIRNSNSPCTPTQRASGTTPLCRHEFKIPSALRSQYSIFMG